MSADAIKDYMEVREKQFKTFSNGALILLGKIIILSISVILLK